MHLHLHATASGRAFVDMTTVGRLLAPVVAAWVCTATPVNAATLLVPTADDQVLERLVAPTQGRTSQHLATKPNVAAALALAQQAVTAARQTGDTRYWGRAQSALAPWWDRADAPIAVAVLQATVLQGRHEFEAARKILVRVLDSGATPALNLTPNTTSSLAQAALTLASLERLSGQYSASLRSCDRVAQAGQAWYAQACRLETQSLQGQWAEARQGFEGLIAMAAATQQTSQVAWATSLLAESEERAGRDAAASAAYQRSLQVERDLYTTLAYADHLLRTASPGSLQSGKILRHVVALLAPWPDTDAVLLRRAHAWRRLGQTPTAQTESAWRDAKATLASREQALRQRGDDVSLHGREAALYALWLDDAPKVALALALKNLDLQQEPIDWRVALESAWASGDIAAAAMLQTRLQSLGLKDSRLAPRPVKRETP